MANAIQDHLISEYPPDARLMARGLHSGILIGSLLVALASFVGCGRVHDWTSSDARVADKDSAASAFGRGTRSDGNVGDAQPDKRAQGVADAQPDKQVRADAEPVPDSTPVPDTRVPDAANVPVSSTVLVGTALPTQQGWKTVTNVGDAKVTSISGSAIVIDTTKGPVIDKFSGPSILFEKNLGIDAARGFVLEWSMKTIKVAPHNTNDAAVAFLGSRGLRADRYQMIYFDEDKIGWADNTQSHNVNTTNGFHVYHLTVDRSGNATLTVDGQPALTRKGYETNGIVAWGDQTNDPTVDGAFAIRYIKVTSY